MNAQLFPLDPTTYVRHALHNDERAWPETNCYVDLWIELMHALHLDPVPAMAFTIAMDFEGDQWTFFKPPLSDLYLLYGIDVQELTVWRPLVEHTAEQVSFGRVVLIEVDAFFLPDTAGVSYKSDHAKTTIAVQAIDTDAKTLGYFHNAGYYTLKGDDFDGIFHIGAHTPTSVTLAPYTEIVKLPVQHHIPASDAPVIARMLLLFHMPRRPRTNPVNRYRERFTRDIAWLQGQDLTVFHQYAFATLRQCGACAELAASFVRWLGEHGEPSLEVVAVGFDTMANTAKALQFKVARAVATKKSFDANPMFDQMAAGWELATELLVRRYGST